MERDRRSGRCTARAHRSPASARRCPRAPRLAARRGPTPSRHSSVCAARGWCVVLCMAERRTGHVGEVLTATRRSSRSIFRANSPARPWSRASSACRALPAAGWPRCCRAESRAWRRWALLALSRSAALLRVRRPRKGRCCGQWRRPPASGRRRTSAGAAPPLPPLGRRRRRRWRCRRHCCLQAPAAAVRGDRRATSRGCGWGRVACLVGRHGESVRPSAERYGRTSYLPA